jgi:hypothetical protein
MRHVAFRDMVRDAFAHPCPASPRGDDLLSGGAASARGGGRPIDRGGGRRLDAVELA